MTQENWDGAKEVQSNWFKTEKVGDKIKGTLVGKKIQPSTDPTFSDQLVVELKKEDGTKWKYGVSVKKAGTVDRLNNCKLGEVVGISFAEELPATKKGFQPTKVIKVYSFGMDPNYSEMDGGEEVHGEEPEM